MQRPNLWGKSVSRVELDQRSREASRGTEGLQTRRWREPDSNRRYRVTQPRFRGRPISPLLDHPLAEKSARTRTDSMTTQDASAGPMVRIRFPPAASRVRT